MVTPVHHATLAKANKAGIGIEGNHDDAVYTAIWSERNKRAAGTNAKQLVSDMGLWKMITLEYPMLRVIFDQKGLTWTIYKGRKALCEKQDTLEAAWNAALDVLEPGNSDDGEGDDDGDDGEGDGEIEAVEGDEDETEEGDEGRSVVRKKYKQRYRPFKMTCGDDLSQLISQHVKVKTDTDDGPKMRIDEKKLEKFAKLNHVWDARYSALNVGMRRMNIANRLRGVIRKNPDYEIIWG